MFLLAADGPEVCGVDAAAAVAIAGGVGADEAAALELCAEILAPDDVEDEDAAAADADAACDAASTCDPRSTTPSSRSCSSIFSTQSLNGTPTLVSTSRSAGTDMRITASRIVEEEEADADPLAEPLEGGRAKEALLVLPATAPAAGTAAGDTGTAEAEAATTGEAAGSPASTVLLLLASEEVRVGRADASVEGKPAETVAETDEVKVVEARLDGDESTAAAAAAVAAAAAAAADNSAAAVGTEIP